MKKFAPLYMALAFLASCTALEPEQETITPAVPQEEHTPFTPGTLLVQFDEETTALIESGTSLKTKAPGLDALLAEWGVTSLRRVFPDAGPFEERTRREGLHRFYRLTFSDGMPVTRAAGSMAGLPGVVSAHGELPVSRRATSASFNDPYFGSQWHLVNARYAGADINVQKVWEEFTTGTPNVIVSVVDDGVNLSHPDLAENIVPNYEDGSGSFNFTNNTPNLSPSSAHGTHVCGTIAARSNNGMGVAGVAGGGLRGETGVRVLSCQIFGGYGEPDIYQAMKHGADHGAVILQCSWGFSPDLDGDGFTTDEEVTLYRSLTIDHEWLREYKAAIDYFIKYAGCDNQGKQLPDAPMQGGLVFFASGNDNFDFDPLVSYDEVVAVGAFGATGVRASYSNYGDWVDIAAPGGDSNLGIYSTLLGSSYGGPDWIGTSFACPHVSGVAALLVSYFGGPGFTAADCKKRLLRGAVSDFFPGNKYIGKKLDAYGAFTYDMNTPAKDPVLTWVDEQRPQTLAYNESAEITFRIEDPNDQFVRLTLEPASLRGVSLSRDKKQAKLIIEGPASASGKHEVTVVGTNEDGRTARLSHTYTVLANRQPELQEAFPAGILFKDGDPDRTLDLSALAADPDGDPLTWEAQVSGECVEAKLEGTTLTISPLRQGKAGITLLVSDGGSDPVARNIPVRVVDAGSSVTVYPVPVTDYLYIQPATDQPQAWTLTLRSALGTKVLGESCECHAFAPGRVNLMALAPGRYSLTLTGPEGTTPLERIIVKQ